MRDTKTPDKIDLELSRSYFRNTLKNKKPQGPDDIRKLLQKNHFKKIANKNKIKKQPGGINRFILISLTILLVGSLAFFITWFFKQKRLFFTVNINVEPLAEHNAYANVYDQIEPKTFQETAKKITSSGGMKIASSTPYLFDLAKYSFNKDKLLYNFEKNRDGWEIPSWELEKPDHMARSLEKTDYISSQGNGSLELFVEFPGKKWTAALIEIQHYLDLKNYDSISADVYLPPEGPEKELRGKIILTAGSNWDFIEMSRSVRLVPGKWVTIKADITKKSTDWRETRIDENIISDIRKIAVRIESYNTPYIGFIYIDNIRVQSQ